MTKEIIYKGYVVELSDDVPGDRRAKFRIPGHPEKTVECGGWADLEIIAKREVEKVLGLY